MECECLSCAATLLDTVDVCTRFGKPAHCRSWSTLFVVSAPSISSVYLIAPPACRCAFDTVPHRHGNADYALLATITELVMMEMERDAFVTPYVPGPPSLEPGYVSFCVRE